MEEERNTCLLSMLKQYITHFLLSSYYYIIFRLALNNWQYSSHSVKGLIVISALGGGSEYAALAQRTYRVDDGEKWKAKGKDE